MSDIVGHCPTRFSKLERLSKMDEDEKAALRHEILAAVYAKAARDHEVNRIMAKFDAHIEKNAPSDGATR